MKLLTSVRSAISFSLSSIRHRLHSSRAMHAPFLVDTTTFAQLVSLTNSFTRYLRHPTFASWFTGFFPGLSLDTPDSLCFGHDNGASNFDSLHRNIVLTILFGIRCFRFSDLLFLFPSSDTPRKAGTWFGEDTLRSITRFSLPSTFGHS